MQFSKTKKEQESPTSTDVYMNRILNDIVKYLDTKYPCINTYSLNNIL